MRILIVDDEPSAAALLAVLLAPYGVCEIADSGAAALSALRAAGALPFGLVCLDVHLGDMEGSEVLDELRRMERERCVDVDRRARVIMVTVVDDPEAIDAAFGRRCDAYLVKPITRDRLLARLSRLGLEPLRRGA